MHDSGTPVSAHSSGLALSRTSVPRNFHTPAKDSPCLKYSSRIENPEVPGPNEVSGTACPVGESMEFN